MGFSSTLALGQEEVEVDSFFSTLTQGQEEMNQGKQELCLRRVEMQDKEQEDRGKPSDLAKIPLCPISPQPHLKKLEEQEKEQETFKTSELACNPWSPSVLSLKLKQKLNKKKKQVKKLVSFYQQNNFFKNQVPSRRSLLNHSSLKHMKAESQSPA